LFVFLYYHVRTGKETTEGNYKLVFNLRWSLVL
jgi:hypothetical protein